MRRVVVTGIGIVSSIGNNKGEVVESLRLGRSGVCRSEEYGELGFRSQVYAPIRLNPDELIDRKIRRFMGDGAAFNYLAMQEAIADAGLEPGEVSNPRTGLIMGSGGPSTSNMLAAWSTFREKGVKKVGPYMVPRSMSNTNSACLATPFQIKGVNYSISSACATSAHCIGNAAEQIQLGKQDIVFAGGGEEVHWTMSVLFDAMGALSAKYNDTPECASRPYDVDRDGFVISGGGGVLVMEELEHAKARGARIYAELTGYGATSDGYDMVQPSGEGAVRCMRQAMATMSGAKVDYVNAHGTSTPVGDIRELEAMKTVFGEDVPPVSSTKSLTGHALGAAGVHEAIYSLLMLEHGFICASANIRNLDPGAAGVPIARERIDDARLDTVMSNSFGFGGTNATLIFQRYAG
ncbi:beta-ketoacyl-ACP synthase I [Methylococcus capsulatus]|jgi:3-oxoacyl-[acyl-carrier-protein] synthase-1|uniref:3-oxoacyl-[acyl-carrier-protein] synthase 1 n=2 Tax=Methylococcus capsulatus TaxID=414 RepID=Q603C8_METCA|nr:beta-ketoacyl-ACP synthase I [Methylococcus capsulatus]AAU91061.1 3-oxoacyl-(acyl-carrier-protein) synthase I [Methylococcus capsulatus str. Bath]QXP86652.1 beta-ketoacyl-ACP synthase I [Methylococcus capsulatus]UQN11616.1 beta-ketoacyl-ACP synthase I [Methylococcus capsulatus]CAI8806445.1 3-oxoacyl-[acyl carrier protein] synthase 1 [Methylococcus capsulatus]